MQNSMTENINLEEDDDEVINDESNDDSDEDCNEFCFVRHSTSMFCFLFQ